MLVGLHGRNDHTFTETDWKIIEGARIESLVLMSFTHSDVVHRARAMHPIMQFIVRLYVGSPGRGGMPDPGAFCDQVHGDIERFMSLGVSLFQIHNEPNHLTGHEGWGQEYVDANAFKWWFLEVLGHLRRRHPGALWGYPGLAVPHKDLEWLEWTRPAVEAADWLGVHVYWQTRPPSVPPDSRGEAEETYKQEYWGGRYKLYHQKFPGKHLHITEYGNSNLQSGIPLDREEQADQYAWWLSDTQQHEYVQSAHAFIATSPDPQWHQQGFTWASQEGTLYPVIDAVAKVLRRKKTPQQPVPAAAHKPAPATPPSIEKDNAMLVTMLQEEFGELFQDLRAKLPVHEADRYRPIRSDAMRYIVFHHSGTARETTCESIARHHVTTNNWPGIGYHFVVRLGRLYYVGDVGTMRAHIKDRNDEGLGVSVTGNYEDKAPMPDDLGICRRLVAVLDRFYGHEKELTVHHKLMRAGYTSCPGRLEAHLSGFRGKDRIDYKGLAWLLEQAARDARDLYKIEGAHDAILGSTLYREAVERRVNG